MDSDDIPDDFEGKPEVRIIRELWLSKKGGLSPGDTDTSRNHGRVFEELAIRELQRLADQLLNKDVRFARGYVVEDYGNQQHDGISEEGIEDVQPAGPRFDVVCYFGNVAWTRNQKDVDDLTPFAVIPKSSVYGVIEVKRTASPGYFPVDSSRAFNNQLNKQQDYLTKLSVDVPLVFVAAHFSGSHENISRKSRSDAFVGLGDLSHKETTERMVKHGEPLARVLSIMFDEIDIPSHFESGVNAEKVEKLQDIAKEYTDDNSRAE
jgi:hypothetical protein